MASLDHVAIGELLRLSTLTSNFAGNRDLGTFSTRFHNESENTVASTTNSKTTEKLVFERLGLGLGAQTAVGDTLSENLNSTLREVEPFLNDGGQLTNALALLAENILSAGSFNDDLSADRGDSDLNTGIAVLGKLTGEELNKNQMARITSGELLIMQYDLKTLVGYNT